MKVREIVKLIEADGWYRVQSTSGHRQFKHFTKRGRVKTGKNILKQAGLNE